MAAGLDDPTKAKVAPEKVTKPLAAPAQTEAVTRPLSITGDTIHVGDPDFETTPMDTYATIKGARLDTPTDPKAIIIALEALKALYPALQSFRSDGNHIFTFDTNRITAAAVDNIAKIINAILVADSEVRMPLDHRISQSGDQIILTFGYFEG